MNSSETDSWMSFLATNNISHANWALNNKDEGASLFTVGSDWSSLSESGMKVKEIVLGWENSIATDDDETDDSGDNDNDNGSEDDGNTADGVDCSAINTYPNWVSKDYAAGPYTHNNAGESIQYENNIYVANWWTNSVPGSDSSWALTSSCN